MRTLTNTMALMVSLLVAGQVWGQAAPDPTLAKPVVEKGADKLDPTADPVGEAPDNACLKLVLEVEAFYADKQDFSANFEQLVVRSHLPDRPIKKKGKVYFKKPGMMRWDYQEPDRVHYISDGKVLWNYIPESKLAYKLSVQDSELFYALKFLFDQGNLVEEFNVGDGGLDKGRRVILVKPKLSEHNFQELRLVVAEDSNRIAETVIIDPAGNESRLVFLKTSYQKLPEKGFTFKPPGDVQVEDLSASQPQ